MAQQVGLSSADVGFLVPVLEAVQQLVGRKPKQVLADARYWSADNADYLAQEQIDGLIATGRRGHDEPIPPCPRGRPPADLTAQQRMQRKLLTRRGRRAYDRRKAIVEAPFGQIKQA